jgi:hypothetical protein
MTTKRESVYIICIICKKTILISKYFPDRQSDLNGIHEYHYNLVKTIPFNPYLRDPSDPLHLPREYEYSIYDNKESVIEAIRKEKQAKRNLSMPRKYDVYKPVFDTINEITESIGNMGYKSDKFSYFRNNTKYLGNNRDCIDKYDYVKPNLNINRYKY